MASKPLLLGHRGFSAQFPENTSLAFIKALEAGADGVECDLQRTRDGEIVVVHDEKADRTSSGKGRISELGLLELQKLDWGRGEKLLTLRDLLKIIPSKSLLNLELKHETLTLRYCQELAAALKKSEIGRNLLISSFEHSLLIPFKKAGFRIGMLVGEEDSKRGVPAFLASVFRLRPHYLNLPHELFERLGNRNARLFVNFLKWTGHRIAFWTINTQAQWKDVYALADVVITDEVEQALRWRQN